MFGKPLKITATWPEGPPEGMSEQDLADAADGLDAQRGKLP
jgi:hypothetical protein